MSLLRALAAETKADEIMATASIHDHAERKRSYDLIASQLEA